jgi:hypothetical protein
MALAGIAGPLHVLGSCDDRVYHFRRGGRGAAGGAAAFLSRPGPAIRRSKVGFSTMIRFSLLRIARCAVILATCAVSATSPCAQGLPPRESLDIDNGLTIAPRGRAPQNLDLSAAMQTLRIPSVSVAVIAGGRLAWARAFGTGATVYTLY